MNHEELARALKREEARAEQRREEEELGRLLTRASRELKPLLRLQRKNRPGRIVKHPEEGLRQARNPDPGKAIVTILLPAEAEETVKALQTMLRARRILRTLRKHRGRRMDFTPAG